MSKSPDLLTKPKFQVLAVSKKLDLLTEPIFQESAVSKKPVLLTGDSFLSYYGERLRDYVLMWKQSGDWLSVRAIFNRFFAFLLNIWPETQNFGLFLRFVLSVGKRLRAYVLLHSSNRQKYLQGARQSSSEHTPPSAM